MSDLSAPDKVTPYLGLIPYAERDAPFFFGRERERAMITANLMASRLTVLYGPSGAGKSSVLRAGVEHTLREQAQRNLEEHGEPELAVVVFNNWRDDPIAGLSLAVHEVVKQTLATMNQADDSLPASHELVQNLELWTKRLNGELLIILDQFEEYFVYHAQEDGEGTFTVEFPRAVNSGGLRVNFLVSLREDALSKLDRFKGRIPNLFDNYLRIGHLTQDAARDAVEKPLEEYNRRQTNAADQVTIEPALVEAVLSQVQTGRVTLAHEGSGGIADSSQQTAVTIETSYLQLVMTRLWDEEMQAGSHTLRLTTLDRLEGAEHIVRTHLDSVMAGLSPAESELAAEVFRYLVTPSGTKIAYTVKDLVAYTNTSGAQLTPVLERLSGSGLRVLRTVDPPPDQPRETRYEIFHDVLAAAILDWRGRYMQEKEKRELEQRLAEEARAEQLRAEEERRRKELDAARKLAESESKRAEAEAHASRRLRRLALALVAVSLIAVVAAVLAVIGWNQTETSAAQLRAANRGLQQLVQSSGEQAAAAQATSQAVTIKAADLQATANAGAHLPAATATAQVAAAQAAATQAAAAQAAAQAAAVQATAQAQAVAAVVSVPQGAAFTMTELQALSPAPARKLTAPSGAGQAALNAARIWNRYGGLIEPLANKIGIDPAAAVALIAVQSGGSGIGPDGRMIIRFENHLFWAYWGKANPDAYNQFFQFDQNASWKGHQYRTSLNSPWKDVHQNQESEWNAFTLARTLDAHAAIQSISMGLTQVLGANYSAIGYDTPEVMFASFSADERFQLLGFFNFINLNGRLLNALQQKDFAGFARIYNGPGQPDVYGQLMQGVYDGFNSMLPSLTQATVDAGGGPAQTQATASLAPWGKSLAGVGMGTPRPFTPAELTAIADSQVEAVKILALPDPEENQQLVTQLKNIKSDMFVVAQLPFPTDSSSQTKFSPQDFVDFNFNALSALYGSGVRYFEIGSEPNLGTNGMGWNWVSGAEFGKWLAQVVNILKPRFPEARWGYPGLSPQPNVDDFLDGSAAAANSADWIGVHNYWLQPSNQPPFPMNGDNAGFYWRAKFKPRFPSKLLMITEFSNNSANTSGEEKGQQYARYYQMLRNEPNIGAAFSAYLSVPGQDASHEGWAGTAIPTTVGALIGQPGFLSGGAAP